MVRATKTAAAVNMPAVPNMFAVAYMASTSWLAFLKRMYCLIIILDVCTKKIRAEVVIHHLSSLTVKERWPYFIQTRSAC